MYLRFSYSLLVLLLFHISMGYAESLVTAVNPSKGPVSAGTAVSIIGSGFLGTTEVNFGNLPATFVVNSDISITASSPQSPPVGGTFDVTVTTPQGTSTISPQGAYTYTGGSWFAYVADYTSNNVTPINLANNTPLADIFVGMAPDAIAITPTSSMAYTVNSDPYYPGATAIHLATQAITSIPIGDFLNSDAMTPDGKTVYVTNSDNTLFPIHTSNNTIGPAITAGNGPGAIAITPNGKTAYIANFLDNSVIPLDLTTNIPGAAIAIAGSNLTAIAIAPNGLMAYVASTNPHAIIPLNLADNTPGKAISVGNYPIDIAITPDGQTAYVVNHLDNSVTPIDLATNTAGPEIPVRQKPSGIAITPDGKRAYVANSDDTVSCINLETHPPTPETPIVLPVGSGPIAIAITPDPSPVASFKVILKDIGEPSLFDGSTSISPVGTIVEYAWDFGDGFTTKTSVPTTTHVYQTSGTFVVTLTVTNSAGTSTSRIFTGRTVSNNGSPRAICTQTVNLFKRKIAFGDDLL